MPLHPDDYALRRSGVGWASSSYSPACRRHGTGTAPFETALYAVYSLTSKQNAKQAYLILLTELPVSQPASNAATTVHAIFMASRA